MPGSSLAYREIFTRRAGISDMAVYMQHSCQCDGRVSSMACIFYFAYRISGYLQVLKQDNSRRKASSAGHFHLDGRRKGMYDG
uniref:Uncharacterized protein LOC103438007 isoform X2 n=1 Tax=Rhizophora mucronata TaxID=61149 RepID=A0A2P2JA63_RHIMU